MLDFEEYFKNEIKKYKLNINNCNLNNIGNIVYSMGHDFELRHISKSWFYLYDMKNLIDADMTYQQLFPNESGYTTYEVYIKKFELSNKELNLIMKDLTDNEFDSHWFTNAILYTKEQIYNNLNKFGYYEFLDILDIYREITEDDFKEFIKKEKNILYELIDLRQFNLNFWEPYINIILPHEYQSFNFLQKQKINDDFVLEYQKLFTHQHIKVILEYQKNNLSEKILNKLQILNKLIL